MSKRRRAKGGRYTPPKLTGARATDAAHQQIAERLKSHLDIHGSWEGVLHGKRVRLTVDKQGRLHHTVLGNA